MKATDPKPIDECGMRNNIDVHSSNTTTVYRFKDGLQTKLAKLSLSSDITGILKNIDLLKETLFLSMLFMEPKEFESLHFSLQN